MRSGTGGVVYAHQEQTFGDHAPIAEVRLMPWADIASFDGSGLSGLEQVSMSLIVCRCWRRRRQQQSKHSGTRSTQKKVFASFVCICSHHVAYRSLVQWSVVFWFRRTSKFGASNTTRMARKGSYWMRQTIIFCKAVRWPARDHRFANSLHSFSPFPFLSLLFLVPPFPFLPSCNSASRV